MATYAIGDLQGCFEPLQRLLGEIGFSPSRDRLWFVGDLVNRGPASLEVLRFVRDLGDRAVTVLGNHDLHLLVTAAGLREAPSRRHASTRFSRRPTDRSCSTGCARSPLMHVEDEYAMVHAGLLPQWSIGQSLELAAEAEEVLRGDAARGVLSPHVRQSARPMERRPDGLGSTARHRQRHDAPARVHARGRDGVLAQGRTRGRSARLPALVRRARRAAVPRTRSLCGHWSALSLRVEPRLLALDTGCLWGRALTAVRLEDRKLFHVSCQGPAAKVLRR